MRDKDNSAPGRPTTAPRPGCESGYDSRTALTRLLEEAGAQCALGLAYRDGVGVAQDLRRAVECFRKAAKQGHAEAQRHLAVLYLHGEGVPKLGLQALKWFLKAADQGDAEAQRNLGLMYVKGEGVARNEQQALEWFRRAAEQGHAGGQYNLGLMYAKGRGVARDKKQALVWFRKAAAQGHAQAQALVRASAETETEDEPVRTEAANQALANALDAFFAAGDLIPDPPAPLKGAETAGNSGGKS